MLRISIYLKGLVQSRSSSWHHSHLLYVLTQPCSARFVGGGGWGLDGLEAQLSRDEGRARVETLGASFAPCDASTALLIGRDRLHVGKHYLRGSGMQEP